MRLVERGAPGPPADVAVAIPVLNGGDRLIAALRIAARQVGVGRVELLAADSGSDDGALERCGVPGLRVFDVDGAYDHGAVRTALVLAARAPFVALLSQDAVPVGDGYLAALLAPFADPRVAGVQARQIPRPGADPLVRASLARWTPDAAAPMRVAPMGGWGALSPHDRLALARFDNVGSAVRRSTIEAVPFPPRPFGEDLAWGQKVLDAGHALAYAPDALVEHHHDPTLAELFRRNRVAHRQAAAEFGLVAVPSVPAGCLAWLAGAATDLRDGGPAWIGRGAARRAAALAGQYLGAREAP